jgi:CheY-like chemotaxis protein
VIECQDEGIGIPAETLPRIFNAFEQGDSRVTRQFGGLGLGLAISKAVAELHHGELVAASEGPGQGATFIIRLPTIPATCAPLTPARSTQDRDSAGSEQKEPTQKEAAAAVGGGLRLLLVEDHRDTADILAKRLRRSGHDVIHAATVAAALQAAHEAKQSQRPFDLVLSDLGLPDGTGFDLMKELNARYGLPGIALSGFGMDADVQRSVESGFARHLTKPVDFEILQRAVMEVHAAATHPAVENGK